MVIVGNAFTVTAIAWLVLLQPVVLFLTVSVPLYNPCGAAPGTTITIGVAGNVAFTTSVAR